MKNPRQLSLLVLPLALACTRAAESAADFAERDSAGVRIVEYSAPVTRTAVLVDSTPVYRIGDDPGEREWTRVVRGALLPDGGAVVVDDGPEVVMFGPDGALKSVLAKPGHGPTEVGSVPGLHFFGSDTIVVEDDGNSKIMIFENGTLARSVPVPGPMTRGAQSVGHVSPATLLMITSTYAGEGEPWLQGRLMRFDLATGKADTVGAYDMMKGSVRESVNHPFQAFGAALASGGRFITLRSDAPEIVWRSADGGVIQRLRWTPTPIYQTDEDLKAFIQVAKAQMVRLNRGKMSQQQADQLVDRLAQSMQIDPSEPMPYFLIGQGDGAGGLWLSDFSMAGPISNIPHWSVVSPDGRWLGSVTLPDRFRLLDVANGRVLGVLEDSLDIQSVAVFDLKEVPRGR